MKKIIGLILSLYLICPPTARAACDRPVISLKEGEAAPCRGFLFTPEKESQMRILDQDYSLLKEESLAKDEIITRLKKSIKESDSIIEKEQQKTNLWQIRAEDSTTKLMKLDQNRTTRDIIMVGAGVLLVVLSAWAAGQVNK